jgi:hypothetical protein
VNLTFGYDQAKVFNGGLFKITFVVLEEEFVFMKLLENDSCDTTMLLNLFIMVWKVERELVSLKNITRGLKRP